MLGWSNLLWCRIVKSSGSNGWLQEEVVQDRGKHKTLHVPIQDPLIEAVLASALGCEAAAPPLWERLYDMAVGNRAGSQMLKPSQKFKKSTSLSILSCLTKQQSSLLSNDFYFWLSPDSASDPALSFASSMWRTPACGKQNPELKEPTLYRCPDSSMYWQNNILSYLKCNCIVSSSIWSMGIYATDC